MSDDRLVAADCGLDQGPLAIAGGSLPLHPPVRVDRRYMPVALTVDPFARAVDRVDPRWNDDGSIGAMPADRAIGRVAVIGAVGCKLPIGPSI